MIASNVVTSRRALVAVLRGRGLSRQTAQQLAQQWIRQADFLLQGQEVPPADFVLGNPPYIRLENVPQARSAAYRTICSTMRGRSDVFVGFIERGLRLLRDDGVLGFIVA